MDEKTEAQILISEIELLMQELTDRGYSKEKISIDLPALTLSDLRQLKRDYRDMLRTIGGAR